MKRNMKRRLMSLVIAFLMVFTYVPAAAYATDNEVNGADAGTAAVAEGPATVLEDQIRIVDSKETASAVDGVVTIKAEGVVTGKPTANKIEIYKATYTCYCAG